jgi:hypothetical protein
MFKRKENEPNCIVVDEKTRKRTREYVPADDIPADSVPWDYRNGRVHILARDLKGKYWPIRPADTIKENETPVDLFMAEHCAAEVTQVYGISMPWSEKIKVGVLVLLIVILVIFIFLIAASAGGAPV